MDTTYRYTCKEVPDNYGIITYELIDPNGKVLIKTKDFAKIETLLSHLNKLLTEKINRWSSY